MKLKDGSVRVSRYFPIHRGKVCTSCQCLFIRERGWKVESLYSTRYMMMDDSKIKYYCNDCGPKLRDDEHCVSKRCRWCPLKLTCLGRPV
jgi:hypothetical protein